MPTRIEQKVCDPDLAQALDDFRIVWLQPVPEMRGLTNERVVRAHFPVLHDVLNCLFKVISNESIPNDF